MKNLTALIIDDEAESAYFLREMLGKLSAFLSIKIIQSSNEAMIELMEETFDVVFLDIEMPTITGIELLKTYNLPPTVIVTSHPSYAVSCFDIDNVVDYIEKPVTMARLARALKRFQEEINRQKDPTFLYFKAGHKTQQFKIDEILFIEADGIYSKIVMKSGEKALVNNNISDIEKKIKHTSLIRLHKSYIFNYNYITSFDSRNLWVGNQKFSLGVNFRGRLSNYLNIDII